jgi:hypothetical protein
VTGAVPEIEDGKMVKIQLFIDHNPLELTKDVTPQSNGSYSTEIKVNDAILAANGIACANPVDLSLNLTATYLGDSAQTGIRIHDPQTQFQGVKARLYNVPSTFWTDYSLSYNTLGYIFIGGLKPPDDFVAIFRIIDSDGIAQQVIRIPINSTNSHTLPYTITICDPLQQGVELGTTYLPSIMIGKPGNYTIEVLSEANLEGKAIQIAPPIITPITVYQRLSATTVENISLTIETPSPHYPSGYQADVIKIPVTLTARNNGETALAITTNDNKLPLRISLLVHKNSLDHPAEPISKSCDLIDESGNAVVYDQDQALTLRPNSAIRLECEYSFQKLDSFSEPSFQLSAVGTLKGILAVDGSSDIQSIDISTENIDFFLNISKPFMPPS